MGNLVPVFIFPPEQGSLVIPPGTGFPFRRLLRLHRITVEIFHPASTRTVQKTPPSSSTVASRGDRSDGVENTIPIVYSHYLARVQL
jgi:hypothetical protein